MRVLIVGTLEGHTSSASKIAIARGAKVTHVDTIDQAINLLCQGQGADLIIVDVRLDVKKLQTILKQNRISSPLIAGGIDADSTLATAAIRAGAKEYLPLPPDPELIAAILEALSQDKEEIIYADSATQKLLTLAAQVAPSDANVLITGESGTGKEVFARYVHRKSKRAGGKFISVNCAALPENLLESELFGHEKGAFTGATFKRIGKFEEANNGTLLLDEISEMHPHLQAKLLRAIQEREIDRIGGGSPVKIDIRLITTSNRNLEEEVKKGNFREDLYFRLNVVNLKIPPLRKRPLDILVLSEYFIKKYCKTNGMALKTLTDEAKQALQNYVWPGNVRELENAIHRSVLLAKDNTITKNTLFFTEDIDVGEGTAADIEAAAQAKGLIGKSLAVVEKELILDTLHHCLGNRTHAANILGISIRTLRNKLKQYSTEGDSVPASSDEEGAGATVA